MAAFKHLVIEFEDSVESKNIPCQIILLIYINEHFSSEGVKKRTVYRKE